MRIKKISVSNLRNLSTIDLSLEPGFNLFYGENGSGKTSLLEAVNILALGRSFRSRQIKRIISYEQEKMHVFAELEDLEQQITPVGIERTLQGTSRFRVAGQTVNSAAELASLLPLQMINPDSYQLLDAGPQKRRQFLDWGLFHVEQSFFSSWQQLQRMLKQRNNLLKTSRDRKQIEAWHNGMVTLTETITEQREAYLEQFLPLFNQLFSKLLKEKQVSISFWRGWAKEKEYGEVLQQSLGRDLDMGFTQYGAHRADLRIQAGKVPAHEGLSRGQQKLLVIALQLTQGILLREKLDKTCLFLIDDLAAELDKRHRSFLIDVLRELDSQVFITGVEYDDLLGSFGRQATGAVFHVEHGVICPQEKS